MRFRGVRDNIRSFYLFDLGSNPSGTANIIYINYILYSFYFALIAQWLERRSHKAWVVGSNPTGGTIINQKEYTMSVTDRSFNPSGNPLIDEIKAKALEFETVIKQLPPGRRRSIALTELESCSMWAVKAAAVGDL